MRSEPLQVFFPEEMTIVDINGNEVCKLKKQLPAKKEIPILQLLVQIFEEIDINQLVADFKAAGAPSADKRKQKIDEQAISDQYLSLLLRYLPRGLKSIPDKLVSCFAILIDKPEADVLENFSLAYIIEVLIPFLLDAFKRWMEQFQMSSLTKIQMQ
jgi:hypothetical protein